MNIKKQNNLYGTNKKILLITATSVLTLFSLTGCATSQPKPIKEKKPLTLLKKAQKNLICSDLSRPYFLSFKQIAYKVAKQENDNIGDIVDLSFYNTKFKSADYNNLPHLKLDLEKKHNSIIEVKNYILDNNPLKITAYKKKDYLLLSTLQTQHLIIKQGSYTLSKIANAINNISKIKIQLVSNFKTMQIAFNSTQDLTILTLLNKITKTISKQYYYNFYIKDNTIFINNDQENFIVKNYLVDAYKYMLNKKGIYYEQNNNAFTIRDSFYKLWFAKRFLDTLNYSEDHFTFCVNLDGKNFYNSFTGNEKIILKNVGKILLIDYGAVYGGKLKYKLVIQNPKNNTVEEYTIYGDKKFFSTQLNSKAVVKIGLY